MRKTGYYAALLLFVLVKSLAAQSGFNEVWQSRLVYLSDSVKANAGLQIIDSLNTIDSIAVVDSTTQTDSSFIPVPRDTLTPINQGAIVGAAEYGTAMNRGRIDRHDYRFAGDLFSNIPGGYLFDLGHLGQPSEVTMYGFGFNNVSFMSDGTSLNNRLLNTFDMFQVQIENVDSIEVIPLPRGFLYGNANNPVAVNLISADRITPKPITQIRFYQGPNNEGHVGAAFNAYMMNKLNGTFDITANGADSRFINSEYESWIASAKLKYLPSNKLNIIGSYKYFKNEVGLNGGVDIEAVKEEYGETLARTRIFEQTQAIVHYGTSDNSPLRYQKVNSHQVELKILGNFARHSKTVFSAFYHFANTEFRQNEQSKVQEISRIFNDNKYKSIGANFTQHLELWIFKGELLSGYESTNLTSLLIGKKKTVNSFSLGGRISAGAAGGLAAASVFGKYLSYDGSTFLGAGADVQLNVSSNLKFYLGASQFDKPMNPVEGIVDFKLIPYGDVNYELVEKFSYKNIEVGTKFCLQNFYGSVNYYYSDFEYLDPALLKTFDSLKVGSVGFYMKKQAGAQGISGNLNFKYSNILLSSNININLVEDRPGNFTIPQAALYGGIYYVDTLFNDNLNLKAGINFKLLGIRDSFVYDFEKGMRAKYIYDASAGTLNLISAERESVNYQFDLFVAGTIQQNAVVYFVWENLLGEDYYYVPYYPKQQRGIRLGLTWTLFN